MSPAAFRDPVLAQRLLDEIHRNADGLTPMKFMEVCGTHTMEIGKLGLRGLLPANVDLLSGPGCPVCVTPGSVVDAAALLAREHGCTIGTFGDMVRVPGNDTSLEAVQSEGGELLVVTSPLQIVTEAREHPDTSYVFIAVGFETTIPVIARAVEQAVEEKLDNIRFLVSVKRVPPALSALMSDKQIGISGFLLPGHVSAIIGVQAYEPIRRAGIPGAITGFEPLDILYGISALVSMIRKNTPDVVNRYTRVVKEEGNPVARRCIDRIFEPADGWFRGIGLIPGGGMALREKYRHLDATAGFGLCLDRGEQPRGCRCGDVLKGIIHPDECSLFASRCTPDAPVGPCMVSSEGSCAAYYRYERHRCAGPDAGRSA